jgi:hypothetical protein
LDTLLLSLRPRKITELGNPDDGEDKFDFPNRLIFDRLITGEIGQTLAIATVGVLALTLCCTP